MSIQQIIQAQYQTKIDNAAASASRLSTPTEGWIKTVRKALNMSAAQLARRLGKTRAAISNMEKAELSGSVTIKAMEELAESMGCRFVYGIVPESTVETIMQQQARKKAEAIVRRASGHMALEAQSLTGSTIASEIDRLSEQFMNNTPNDLWND